MSAEQGAARPCEDKLVDYNVTGTRLTVTVLHVLTDQNHEALLDCLSRTLKPDIDTLLFDKRGIGSHTIGLGEAKSFGTRLGDLLSQHRVKAALVIDPSDFFTTALCVFAMDSGAKVMATQSRSEAVAWLDGRIK